jgi:hypothetical protein
MDRVVRYADTDEKRFQLMLKFCFDRVYNHCVGYPNLAKWTADPYTTQWRQYDHHWPRTVPLRLLMYFQHNNISFDVEPIETANRAWYPVAFGWFDFECDYISLMSATAIEKVKTGTVKILFYYHEGDNPQRIKQRLDQLCRLYQLPDTCYLFISANTAARDLDQCLYFSDHEFFFRHLNRQQFAGTTNAVRPYDFTLLSRTHKWWRASCVSDLVSSGLLKNSLWSYNTSLNINDDPADNPLELDQSPGWSQCMQQFINAGPYVCDIFDSAQQNDHHIVNESVYCNSNVHIVLETHFDADQSSGAFITEKTYKPIKYGQPFLIVGPAGTLDQLRADGYKTFDDVIDNRYDNIADNTQRWFALKQTIANLYAAGTSRIFEQCHDDLLHNQQMFLSRTVAPLNTLYKDLLCLV